MSKVRFIVVIVAALAITAPVRALDISGHVLNKAGEVLAGAQVCIKSDSNTCVATDAAGAFHLSKPLSLGRPEEVPGRLSLRFRGGNLLVRSPAAQEARLEWLSPSGRTVLEASDLRLAPGETSVPLPAAAPRAGICLLRLTAAGRTQTWKAVLAPGGAAAGTGTPGRLAALSKTAAATLEISKTGYRTRLYEPGGEVETDALIFLNKADDVGLDFSGSARLKVVSIDRTAKTFVTETEQAYCDPAGGSGIVRRTVRDTQSYAIRGGRMWTWTPGDCYGQMFTGTSDDLVGTWNMVDFAAVVPEDLRGGCTIDSTGSDDGFYQSFRGEYIIGDTVITGTFDYEVCPGDFFGMIFGSLFAPDTSVRLTRTTCLAVEFANGAGETGVFAFSKRGDSIHAEFSGGPGTCSENLYFGGEEKEPVCPEGDGFLSLFTCVMQSGFADVQASTGTSAMAAAPALPMSLAKPGLLRSETPGRSRSAAFGTLPAAALKAWREGKYISSPWTATDRGR